MRLVMAFLYLALAGGICAGAEAAGEKKFQICKSDSPQNCEGRMLVPCDLEAGSLAQFSCAKKGWNFFTLAKVKEIPGGKCGATIYDVKCE